MPVFEGEKQKTFRGAIAVALNETEARKFSPPDAPLVVLQLNSVQDAMRGKRRPQKEELVGLASHWEKFLRWSQTMLLAAGIENEQIILRDARTRDWQKGLDLCTFVIADSLTAKELPANFDVRVFRLVSDASLAELKNLIC